MTKKLISTLPIRSTLDSVTRTYYYYDDDHTTPVDESEAIAAAYSQWYLETGLLITDRTFDRKTDHSAEISITWKPGRLRDLRQPQLVAGRAIRWRFSFSAKGQHVTRTLKTKAYLPDVFGDPTDFAAGILGFSKVNGVISHRGINVPAPPPTFMPEFHIDNALVTPAYVKALGDICGSVALGIGGDATDFDDMPKINLAGAEFEEGELFLSTCNGGQIDDERWVISLGISYLPNETGLKHPGLPGVYNKQGHDIEWTFDELRPSKLFGDDEFLAMEPQVLYVEQVWPYKSWSLLGLPTS